MGRAASAQSLELVSTYTWQDLGPGYGGFSSLEMTDGGRGFVTATDKSVLVRGRLLRKGEAIIGVADVSNSFLTDANGQRMWAGETDSEGMALAPDGVVLVSFEGSHSIRRYAPDGRTHDIAVPTDFENFLSNGSIETLAIDAAGAIYTIPERSGDLNRAFPIWRLRDETWDMTLRLSRRNGYLPVGGDFGPDDRLYVLERKFNGPIGFSSRIRSFAVTEGALVDETTLVTTPSGVHDNLEGLSVWMAGRGDIRLTMISDDNFRAFQATEFVEYRLLP